MPKLIDIPNRPRWLKRLERKDSRGQVISRFVVHEQNKLFEITGKKRRYQELPDWVNSINKAVIEGERIRKEWMSPPSQGTRPRSLISFKDTAVKFLEARRAKWRDSTHADAKWWLDTHIIPYFETNYPLLNSLSTESVWAYLTFIKDSAPGQKRFNHRKWVLAVANYAFDEGLIPKKLKVPAKGLDPNDEAGRCITARESARLEAISRRNPALHVQFLLGRYCGMRKNEILKLPRKAFDGRTITLVSDAVKTGRGRVIPVPSRVLGPFKKFLSSHDSPWVFPGLDNPKVPVTSNKSAWEKLKIDAKVKCRFHDLRVTSITTMLNAGIDSLIVSKIHGVSPDIIVKHYLKAKPEELLASMERALSRGKNMGNEK